MQTVVRENRQNSLFNSLNAGKPYAKAGTSKSSGMGKLKLDFEPKERRKKIKLRQTTHAADDHLETLNAQSERSATFSALEQMKSISNTDLTKLVLPRQEE